VIVNPTLSLPTCSFVVHPHEVNQNLGEMRKEESGACSIFRVRKGTFFIEAFVADIHGKSVVRSEWQATLLWYENLFNVTLDGTVSRTLPHREGEQRGRSGPRQGDVGPSGAKRNKAGQSLVEKSSFSYSKLSQIFDAGINAFCSSEP